MQQAIFSPLKRIRLHEEYKVASVGKSDVGEKIKPANGKTRIKKNYKPKANDKG